MDLLKRGQIPPYPQFYELLYTYATGVNPSLNQRINQIFRDGTATTDLAERLYNEFLKSAGRQRAHLDACPSAWRARIEAVHDAIDTAMATANAYSGSLQSASGDLDARDERGRTARPSRQRLLSETRRMQDANHQLEQKLEASRDDIAALQRDLDEVRRESMLDPLTKIFNRKILRRGHAQGVRPKRRARHAALPDAARYRPLQALQRHLGPPDRRPGAAARGDDAQVQHQGQGHRRALWRRRIRRHPARDRSRGRGDRRRQYPQGHPGQGTAEALDQREARPHHRLVRRRHVPPGRHARLAHRTRRPLPLRRQARRPQPRRSARPSSRTNDKIVA